MTVSGTNFAEANGKSLIQSVSIDSKSIPAAGPGVSGEKYSVVNNSIIIDLEPPLKGGTKTLSVRSNYGTVKKRYEFHVLEPASISRIVSKTPVDPRNNFTITVEGHGFMWGTYDPDNTDNHMINTVTLGGYPGTVKVHNANCASMVFTKPDVISFGRREKLVVSGAGGVFYEEVEVAVPPDVPPKILPKVKVKQAEDQAGINLNKNIREAGIDSGDVAKTPWSAPWRLRFFGSKNRKPSSLEIHSSQPSESSSSPSTFSADFEATVPNSPEFANDAHDESTQWYRMNNKR